LPEVAGETPQDPDIVGALIPEEMAMIQALRQKGNQITMEIGNIEVRKSHLFGVMADTENRIRNSFRSVRLPRLFYRC